MPSKGTWLCLAVLAAVGALALAIGRPWFPLGASVAAVGPAVEVTNATGEPPDDNGDAIRSGAAHAGELESAAQRLLATRSAALASHDESAWESTIADPTSEDGRRQLAAYPSLLALGISELTASDVRAGSSELGALRDGGPAPNTVTVRLAHRIPGYDREPRVAARTLTLASTPSGWRIASDASANDQLQVWDLPGLRVVRSATTLVAGDVPESTLAERRADADAAADRLSSLFGAATPSVLVVPATDAEAARQLGHPESQTPSQVAATTDGQLGSLGTAGADRVVLAPDAFRRLTPEGRRVVVTHELTHVATRATTASRLPSWLSEGFAEYVAWGPVSMPLQTAAAQLLAQVRSEGLPVTLPEASDFDSSRADLATAYQASWLAVRTIADAHGEQELVAFYHAVAGVPGAPGLSVDDALSTVLGTSAPAVVGAWRAELQRLAR